MATAISAQQLAVTFRARGRQGAVAALQPLDLDLAPGTITGLLGPNGSGKTTLLRVLAGLQAPTGGRVAVLGRDPADPALLPRVGYQPDGPLPLDTLSAAEFLAWTGARLGLPNTLADARAAALLARLDLQRAGRRWLRTFSTGMQKRLGLAAALLAEPAVLLLDEPTAGLDPSGSAIAVELLRERAAAGACILLASHQLNEVEELCGEVLLLQDGAVRLRGPLGALLATGDHALVVRGLPPDGPAALAAAAQQLGGTVVRSEPWRGHLFALFRRLAAPPEPRP